MSCLHSCATFISFHDSISCNWSSSPYLHWLLSHNQNENQWVLLTLFSNLSPSHTTRFSWFFLCFVVSPFLASSIGSSSFVHTYICVPWISSFALNSFFYSMQSLDFIHSISSIAIYIIMIHKDIAPAHISLSVKYLSDIFLWIIHRLFKFGMSKSKLRFSSVICLHPFSVPELKVVQREDKPGCCFFFFIFIFFLSPYPCSSLL